MTLLMLISCWVFVAYLLTLCPTVSGADSGELVTVAYRLGVAHPPGYPLFTLLGHLSTYVPFGSIAWRVNLLSALLGLGASSLMFLILDLWLANPWGAFFGAGLFAFSPLAWRYSVVAEVFSLNNLLLAGFVYFLLRYAQSTAMKWASLMVLDLGLIVSHHHTLLLMVLPMGTCILARDRSILLRPRPLLTGLGLFFAGTTPYLFMPWASSRRLMSSWGDLTTLNGFLDHLLRREYGTFQLVADEAGPTLLSSLARYFMDSFEQLLFVGALFALWGMVRTQRDSPRPRIFPGALLLAFTSYTLIFHALSNLGQTTPGDREMLARFWLAPNFILCLFAGKGFAASIGALRGRGRWLVPAISVGLVLGQFALHYKVADSSQDRIVHDFGRATLDSLPPKALFLTRGDLYVNSIRYLQECEGFRKDVVVLPLDLLATPWMAKAVKRWHPEIRLPAGGEGPHYLRSFLDINREPEVFIPIPLLPGEREALKDGYQIWNVGFANKVLAIDQPFGFKDYLAASRVYSGYAPPGEGAVRGKPWATFVYEQYWAREQNRVERLSLQPVDGERGFEMVRHSTQLLERFIRQHPQSLERNYRTLVMAYWKLARIDPRYKTRLLEVWKDYISMNPTDPGIDHINDLIRSTEP